MSLSLRDRIADLPPDRRAAAVGELSRKALRDLRTQAWRAIARPEQLAPDGGWLVWFYRGGRGSGKTRAAGEWTREKTEQLAAAGVEASRIALVGRKLDDVRQTMCEGESGLARVLPPSLLVNGSWEDSFSRGVVELRLTNGAYLKGYSSQVPDALRGPQHHAAWVDEPASLRDAHLGTTEDTTWSNLLLGLRLPPSPQVVVSGTPKNTALVHEMRAEPFTVETTASTYENLHNLAPIFRETVVARYEGTRLGRQELLGELLGDVGSMFQRSWFDLIDEVPTDPAIRWVRCWDLAATEENDSNTDPDWTVGALVGFDPNWPLLPPEVAAEMAHARRPRRGRYIIRHIARFRLNPGSRDDRIRQIASEDRLPSVHVEQEPGSAGKSQVSFLDRHLSGVAKVRGWRPTGSKETRAELLAGPAEQGRVSIVSGPWVLDLLDELEEFPNGSHDDQVDACSMAIDVLRDRGIARPVPRRQLASIPRVQAARR